MGIKDILRLILYASMVILGVCNIIGAVKRKRDPDKKYRKLEGLEIASSIMIIISGAVLLVSMIIAK